MTENQSDDTVDSPVDGQKASPGGQTSGFPYDSPAYYTESALTGFALWYNAFMERRRQRRAGRRAREEARNE